MQWTLLPTRSSGPFLIEFCLSFVDSDFKLYYFCTTLVLHTKSTANLSRNVTLGKSIGQGLRGEVVSEARLVLVVVLDVGHGCVKVIGYVRIGGVGSDECGRKNEKREREFRFHHILPHPKIPPNLNVSQGDLLSPLSDLFFFFSLFSSLLFRSSLGKWYCTFYSFFISSHLDAQVSSVRESRRWG